MVVIEIHVTIAKVLPLVDFLQAVNVYKEVLICKT